MLHSEIILSSCWFSFLGKRIVSCDSCSIISMERTLIKPRDVYILSICLTFCVISFPLLSYCFNTGFFICSGWACSIQWISIVTCYFFCCFRLTFSYVNTNRLWIIVSSVLHLRWLFWFAFLWGLVIFCNLWLICVAAQMVILICFCPRQNVFHFFTNPLFTVVARFFKETRRQNLALAWVAIVWGFEQSSLITYRNLFAMSLLYVLGWYKDCKLQGILSSGYYIPCPKPDHLWRNLRYRLIWPDATSTIKLLVTTHRPFTICSVSFFFFFGEYLLFFLTRK